MNEERLGICEASGGNGESMAKRAGCALVCGLFLGVALPVQGAAHLTGWGTADQGQISFPKLTNLVAVSAGNYHTLALTGSGTVYGWGKFQSFYGDLPVAVPHDLTNIIQIAGGFEHLSALRADGSVVAWRRAEYLNSGYSLLQLDLTNLTAISGCHDHAVGLQTDGTVVQWGKDLPRVDLPGLDDVQAVSAGANLNLALRLDGTVVSWHPSQPENWQFVPGLDRAVEISAGHSHGLALLSDSSLTAWKIAPYGIDWIPPGVTFPDRIQAGNIVNGGVLEGGVALVWGDNGFGQTNVPAGLPPVLDLSFGSTHAVALVGFLPPRLPNRLQYHHVGAGSRLLFSVPVEGSPAASIQWFRDNLPLAVPSNRTLRIDNLQTADSGRYRVRVANALGVVEADVLDLVVDPLKIVGQPTDASATLGEAVVLSVVVQGSSPLQYQWHHNGQELAGETASELVLTDLQLDDAGQYEVVVSNLESSLISRAAAVQIGLVASWGYLAHNSYTVVPAAAPAGLTNVTALSAGAHHTLGLLDDGRVTAWGYDWYGEATVPAQATDAIGIVAGSHFSIAQKSADEILAWGQYGPTIQVPPSATNLAQLAAGVAHTIGLRQDGTVVAWPGQNIVPQGLSNVVEVAAGSAHGVALRSDGSLVGWGDDWFGQLGFTNATGIFVRVQAKAGSTLARRSDGEWFVWGELADEFQTNRLGGLPGFSNIHRIAPGGAHVVAQHLDGSLAVWGRFSDGSMWHPAQLPPNLPAVSDFVAGSHFGHALLGPGTPPRLRPAAVTRSVAAGRPAVFAVDALGTPPFQYQWRRNGVDVPGATGAQLLLTGAELTDAGDYSVRISNAWGSLTGQVARLEVDPLRLLAVNGPERGVLLGTAAFNVEATGIEPISYQWQKDGIDIPGATGATLQLSPLAFADAGTYRIVVSNPVETEPGPPQPLEVSMIAAWGNNDEQQVEIPAGLTNIVRIASGEEHGLALRADGTLAAWGSNFNGQSVIPAAFSNRVAVAIAATGRHNLALFDDETVASWGDQTYWTTVPAGLTNVVAITTGGYSSGPLSLALKRNGTLVPWGLFDFGVGTPVIPPWLTNVIEVASGGYNFIALQADGTVTVLGGRRLNPQAWSQLPPGLPPAVAVAASHHQCLAMLLDGSVVAWDESGNYLSNLPPGLSNIDAWAAHGEKALALTQGGTVLGWGINSEARATAIAALPRMVDVATGLSAEFALVGAGPPSLPPRQADRMAVAGGRAVFRAHATGERPLGYQWLHQGNEVPGATNSSFVLHDVQPEDAGLYTLRVSNSLGVTNGAASTLNVLPLYLKPGVTAVTNFVGTSNTLSVVATGVEPAYFQWFHNGVAVPDGTNASLSLPDLGLGAGGIYHAVVSNALAVATSETIAMVVQPVLHLGYHLQSSSTSSMGPAQPPVLFTNVVEVAAGVDHSLLLFDDGRVHAWGRNHNNQCDVPPGLTNVVAVSAGASHSLALRSDGSVVAWGRFYNGSTWTSPPVPGSVTNIVAIASGDDHALALGADGLVRAWGYHGGGATNVPAGLSNVVEIAASGSQSLALRADGTVRVWGGDAWVDFVTDPPFSNVVTIASGTRNNYAVHFDGTLSRWGLGPPEAVSLPAAATNLVSVATGWEHAVALDDNGTVHGWGTYSTGQSNIDLTLPHGGLRAGAIAARQHHTLFLGARGKPALAPRLADRVVGSGGTVYLRAKVSGAFPRNYQWQRNGEDIPHATNQVLRLSQVDMAHTGEYRLVVANASGQSTGAVHQITVLPVMILSGPADQLSHAGSTVTLSVSAQGQSPLHYAWRHNGVPIPDSDRPDLVLGPLTIGQAGLYDVVVTSPEGGTSSRQARVGMTEVVAWGSLNPFRSPAGELTNVLAISSGLNHGLALKSDGTVTSWGLFRTFPQIFATPPAGLGNVRAVASGYDHALALRSDGSIVAWGRNDYGQITVPPAASNVVAIAAGREFSMALDANGKLTVWGGSDPAIRQVPSGLRPVVAMAASVSQPHCLVVLDDGTVQGWGGSSFANPALDIPPDLKDAVSVATGVQHSLALHGDGTVSAWGLFVPEGTPALVPAGLSGVVAVAAAGGSCQALLANGETVVWGSNYYGHNNLPIDLTGVSDVANSPFQALALVGQQAPWMPLKGVDRTVATGNALTLHGRATGAHPIHYQWQWNGNDLPGATNPVAHFTGLQPHHAGIYTLKAQNARGAAVGFASEVTVAPLVVDRSPLAGTHFLGSSVNLAVEVSGNRPFQFRWFKDGIPLPDATNATLILHRIQPEQAGSYSVQVMNSETNVTTAAAQIAVQSVVVWGRNNHGELNPPPALGRVRQAASGWTHNLALLENGTVRAWGSNTHGQSTVPANLPPATGIAAGLDFSVARLESGEVIAWGRNDSGQTSVPVGLANVVELSAGSAHVLARFADGTVAGWGANGAGQLNIPPGLSGIVAISAGGGHSAAITSDARVVVWGSHSVGQTNVPAWLDQVVAIASGSNHLLALRRDGSLAAWGDHREGQTVIPAGLHNIVAIGAGHNRSLAAQSDGTVVGWGADYLWNQPDFRQLGQPVTVQTGFEHGLALLGLLDLGELAIATDNGNVTLIWPGSAGVWLQTTGNLTPPIVWQDVPHTEGKSSHLLPDATAPAYYRLALPGTADP